MQHTVYYALFESFRKASKVIFASSCKQLELFDWNWLERGGGNERCRADRVIVSIKECPEAISLLSMGQHHHHDAFPLRERALQKYSLLIGRPAPSPARPLLSPCRTVQKHPYWKRKKKRKKTRILRCLQTSTKRTKKLRDDQEEAKLWRESGKWLTLDKFRNLFFHTLQN